MNIRAAKTDSVFSGHYTLSDDKVNNYKFRICSSNIKFSPSLLISVGCFLSVHLTLNCIWNIFCYSVAGWSCSLVSRQATDCVENPSKVLQQLELHLDFKLVVEWWHINSLSADSTYNCFLILQCDMESVMQLVLVGRRDIDLTEIHLS